MTKVVITMPAYHAADTLERTVAGIPVGIADELILVDDASGDETVADARKLNITVYVHDENRGYGGNQKTCYRRALEHGADIVVMLHPDYQYDPTAVPLLIAPLLAGRADMTFGSRFAGLSDPRGGGMPLYRYLGNRTATTLENLMLGSRFTELHSGLRAYTRRCLLELPILRYSDARRCAAVSSTRARSAAPPTLRCCIRPTSPARPRSASSRAPAAGSPATMTSSAAWSAA